MDSPSAARYRAAPTHNSFQVPLYGRTTYNQPINVASGGKLNIVTDTTVASYIQAEANGTVIVKGDQASPSVTLIITGGASLGTAVLWGLNIAPSGILNLSPGSTIQGSVLIQGGMNLGENPPGSYASTATITGNFSLEGGRGTAILNLNNYTLSVTLNADFENSIVTTNVSYGGANDAVQMGKITVGGTAKFIGARNNLIQSATGTRKAFSLPLLTAATLTGEFSTYQRTDGVQKTKVGNTITLSYDPNAQTGNDPGELGGQDRNGQGALGG